MKITITAAAALIGLAAVFGPAGAASAASLPDGTPVIEVGGRHFGGQRSGHRGGRREFGHRGDGRRFRLRRGHRGYARGHRHRHGRHGHGHGHGHNYYGPFIYGGIALGTYLFLDTLDRY